MKQEKRKISRKTVAAVVVLLLAVLLAAFSAATARSLLFQGVHVEEVHVAGLDGARLRCLVYKPLGSTGRLPAVIVVHGLGASSDTMNAISTELARNGVLVLAMNYRGHDGSEGGVNYIGDPLAAPNISNDLVVAFRYLAERSDVDAGRIGAVGYSMGSRAVLRLALLIPTVNPVVMIGPYVGWEIGAVNTTSPRNLLIIVGSNDVITPPSLAELLFNYATRAAGKPSEVFGSLKEGTGRKLVVVPGADHYAIVFTKQAVEETVEWVLASFGMGRPSLRLDPAVLASISSSASLLTLIGILSLAYLVARYLRGKGLVAELKPTVPGKAALAVVLVGALYYMLAAYAVFPLVVDWGWREYQFARFSGAQYTVYYFLFLAIPLLLAVAVYTAVRRGALAGLRDNMTRNLLAGLVTALVLWLFMYAMYNLSMTGVVANYTMTPLRFALMLYLLILLLPLVLVDELFLRRIMQDKIPTGRWWARLAAAAALQYLVRVLPLAWWVSLAANPLAVDSALKPYLALHLISEESLEVVKGFIAMNAYGLYYAFMGVELLHAFTASYLYEEYRNILATAFFRALTVAFTMAAVLAIL